MENKLKEVFDRHWKGFMSYDDYTKADMQRLHKEYTVNEFYEALKAAYNAGIEIAANEFERINFPPPGMEDNYQECSKQDLLDLQIE